MSDPIGLRNAMSGSVYAEQMNSAQIQGQAAAREKAARVKQEALRNEQAQIKSLEEAAESSVEDREARPQHPGNHPGREDAEDRDEPHTSDKEAGGIRHIDLTV